MVSAHIFSKKCMTPLLSVKLSLPILLHLSLFQQTYFWLHQWLFTAVLLMTPQLSNTIVSIFLNWEIFFTPLILAWWFSYWGCKVVTFIIICGLFARWFTVAFISFDRFRRIFFALIYPRYSKKFMIILTVSSWVFSLVTAVIMPQWAESAGGTQ